MAFVKLDTGILNSTLWVEREQREIFITALLMALPHEVREPMEAIHVGEIRSSGFVVPPGWYGFVPAAGPGIVRMAMVDPVTGMAALARLGEPDRESRTSEFGGRRLVRVDGGFIVLNFMKYRDKDMTASDRSARYRQRQKEVAVKANVTRDAVPVTRDSSCGVTKAEAEALREQEMVERSPVGDLPPPPAFDGKNFKSINGKAVVALSTSWELPEEWGVDAEALGWQRREVLLEAEKFRQFWTAGKGADKRRAVKGWRQTWSNWLSKAAEMKR